MPQDDVEGSTQAAALLGSTDPVADGALLRAAADALRAGVSHADLAVLLELTARLSRGQVIAALNDAARQAAP